MGLPWLHPDEEVLCLYNILIWNIQIQRHTTMQLQKCKINKCAQRSAKQAFTAIRMGPHDSRWGGEVLRSLYWYEIYKYWYEICYTDLLIWNIQILIHILIQILIWNIQIQRYTRQSKGGALVIPQCGPISRKYLISPPFPGTQHANTNNAKHKYTNTETQKCQHFISPPIQIMQNKNQILLWSQSC